MFVSICSAPLLRQYAAAYAAYACPLEPLATKISYLSTLWQRNFWLEPAHLEAFINLVNLKHHILSVDSSVDALRGDEVK